MVDFIDNIRGEMPFLDHLEELRHRLFWCAAAILLGIIIAFPLINKFDLLAVLAAPVTKYMKGQKLIYTHPGDPLSIAMQASFAIGLIIAAPVIVYHLWRFISPAMYAREKKIAVPVIAAAFLLFTIGMVIGYLWVLPMSLRFLFEFSGDALQPMIVASEYFGFAIMLCASFGAVFELPIVILLLSALGVVSVAGLGKVRRYIIVGGFIVGAFIAMDLSSMFIIALLFYVLYEVSIGLAFFVERGKKKKKLREEAEEAGYLVDDAPKRLGEA